MGTYTSINERIRHTIDRAHHGMVYFPDSFPNIDEDYAGKILASLTKCGKLLRVGQGIYVKPFISERFGPFSPNVSDIVAAVAKRDNADVLPTGVAALNKLGLSEQVPMNAVYITSGTARVLNISGRKIILRHVSPSNFNYKGKLVPLLVQALKALGKDGIDDEIRYGLIRLLSAQNDPYFEDDINRAPVWMKKLIKSLQNEIQK